MRRLRSESPRLACEQTILPAQVEHELEFADGWIVSHAPRLRRSLRGRTAMARPVQTVARSLTHHAKDADNRRRAHHRSPSVPRLYRPEGGCRPSHGGSHSHSVQERAGTPARRDRTLPGVRNQRRRLLSELAMSDRFKLASIRARDWPDASWRCPWLRIN